MVHPASGAYLTRHRVSIRQHRLHKHRHNAEADRLRLALHTYVEAALARSTQLGDFTAFFVFTAVMCWLGAITQQGHYLQSAGLLLFLAAVFRTLAWAIYGAAFATDFIVFEVVCAGLLSFSASRIGRDANII